jgi:myo-inositol 2-dehydrogenase / D-chiro-inositol 1-dehydrogenase
MTNVAIFGAGRIGKIHASNLARQPGVSLKYVVDVFPAAAAGKAIFCEKPVDLDVERARKCADAVSKASVTCMIGFNRRFDPTFAALKARLDAGEIGTPEMLIITSRDPQAPPVPYIKASGGIFRDMLIHDLDIFRWILEDEAETPSCDRKLPY